MYCQLVYIVNCVPARIRHALAELPETLDETYQRILREINKAEWEFAHRLFQCVAVASRPLRVEELAELLAFDFDTGPIPKFHEDWRLEDPVDAVLSTCSSLLSIVDGGYPFGNVIQFSHFSVKEFLTSDRLAEESDIILRRYHISMTPAHTFAAQACLGILLHLDEDVTENYLENLPFAGYAAEHWADHAMFEGVSRSVEDGIRQLFDPSKPHFAVCIWIRDPDALPQERNRRAERPLPLHRTPLHYAALLGLHSIVEFLVVEHSQDVRSRGFTDNVTPLHLASKRGHGKVARMLIEHGADTTAQNKDGETPLHLSLLWGQVEVARMLIEHSTDVMAQNTDGETPLYLALFQSLHLALFRAQVTSPRMRFVCGADVAAQDKDGETPLHLASRKGQVEVVRMLLERGVDVTVQNMDGEVPLHLASREGQADVARMLIEGGADVTAQNKDGETPLHLTLFRSLRLASFRGQVRVPRMRFERGGGMVKKSAQQYGEVARILLEHGADVNARNKKGSTPFHLASRGGLAEVTRVLLQHSADPSALDNMN